MPATRAALSQLSVNAKRQNGGVCDYASGADEATLFNIAVDPDYQRQGLGRVLLEHLIDELEKRGVADTMAGSPVPQMLPPCPVRKFRL
ncbi:GNAT family N-acetyltransferase [Escherichia coli]|uniref:GNAT family N-acetyltransferase n=1 Tax=Escherichia coli TaxID=562 RepID=UPI0039A6E6F2